MESCPSGQLSFSSLYLNGIRDCLEPFCDFQIHFIYKLPYSTFKGLKRVYIDLYKVFRGPNSDHFSGGRKLVTTELYSI